MNYYIPSHEILHDHSNDYINLQNLELHDVMAYNLKVITYYYMHYQPLHAPQDANGVTRKLLFSVSFQLGVCMVLSTSCYLRRRRKGFTSVCTKIRFHPYCQHILEEARNFITSPFLSSKCQLTHYNLKV